MMGRGGPASSARLIHVFFASYPFRRLFAMHFLITATTMPKFLVGIALVTGSALSALSTFEQAVGEVPVGQAAVAAQVDKVSFNDQIRPILSGACFSCHGPDEKHREADLRLDLRGHATGEDGSGVTAIVPGDWQASAMIERILSDDPDLVMPPPAAKKERLTPDQIETLRRWIDEGAEYQPHWAFMPLRTTTPPNVSLGSRASNPIDRFIANELERIDLAPSPAADRATLIRRVSLDLSGLLPEPEDVDAFVRDRRPDAFDRLVDRLLASPHFAERWGRHWLDQARYADSHGYSIDSQRSMWPYRDWVIRAVGDDMPLDQFTVEQLAGDLLPDATKQQIIATAFHRNTLINQEGGVDPEQFRHESVVDRVNTTGVVWLGLTLGCAQCHTHKFDPITHREYYEMFAFFNSTTDVNNAGATVVVEPGEVLGFSAPQWLRHRQAEQVKREAELKTILQGIAEPVDDSPSSAKSMFSHAEAKTLLKAIAARRETRTADQQSRLLAALRKAFPEQAEQFVRWETSNVMVMQELPDPRETFISVRGDFLRPDTEIGPLRPRPPRLVQSIDVPEVSQSDGDALTRLDLARWLVSPENPLTPRVTVNRVWMRYFGIGLVETEEDFGTQGTPPTHPELLDWLARDFIEHGMSMKRLHRLIVTSDTYRQSSVHRDDIERIDPRNRLLSRQNRIRFEAEIVRDSALSASGLLDRTLGGPSVHPPQPGGVYAFTQRDKAWVEDQGGGRYRRAMYTEFFRSAPHPMFTTFDAPDFQVTCTRRPRSNTPLQALALANDGAFLEFAAATSRRIMRERGDATVAQRVRHAFRLLLGRSPSPGELATLEAYHDSVAADRIGKTTLVGASDASGRSGVSSRDDDGSQAAMAAVVRAILNTDNFITRE